jgi:hypothetical protein
MTKLSKVLSEYDFDCYPDNANWSRTYFEFTARVKNENPKKLNANQWVEALIAEGCVVSKPRYPLLHEQPFFTEGAFRSVLRLPDNLTPEYLAGGFEQTRGINESMIKFPCFTTEKDQVLNQYIDAIHKIGKNQSVLLNGLNNK